jgi:[ribosomal protein S18]-alanine N-acetyltransferase
LTAGRDQCRIIGPGKLYFAATDGHGMFISYYCHGAEARVAGGDYSEEALDIGAWMRPELTGRELGPAVINSGMEYGAQRFGASRRQATVAVFNERAIRACVRVGLVVVGGFKRSDDGTGFVILMREAV